MQNIYNVKTGEAKIVEAVDAREHIASGRWSTETLENRKADADAKAAEEAAFKKAQEDAVKLNKGK